ncbi:peptidyl-prolyl cis-trans isomerase FKBP19, chloroplastic isoform X2 [Spinacia oleracea]|uniref:peptidylprolyl isomerase n=1 Tax=Spinacia oleracea TaxID=3562 RepID=A0A9R0IX68_SPIOL|nr:peptidyl-prolyl cis-trans isomerase FKBP19, chloroplastic isoform X2 [Spinacia oleracea]
MGTKQLQLPLTSSSSSSSSSSFTGPSSLLSHRYHCCSTTTTSLPFNRTTTNNHIANTTLSLSLNHVNRRLRRRSIQLARFGLDDSVAWTPATATAFEEEEDDVEPEPTPGILEYIGQINRVLELLKKNKDILFGEKWQRRFNCTPLLDFINLTCRSEENSGGKGIELNNRRHILLSSVGISAGYLLNAAAPAVAASSRSGFADMPALRGKDYGKTKMRYPDYTETESGLQFKDLRTGTGPTPKVGETAVVDWAGYTIGYYGRIFEARNKTKGGSFEGDDQNYFKFKIGSHEVIPAFEEAVTGMSFGGIRRIIVPPELGYPENDYNKKGPKPTTFSGQRALDFVLRNQGLIDKTLLFDIELLKIIPN